MGEDCTLTSSTSSVSAASIGQESMLNNNSNVRSPNDNFICGVVEGFYGRPWTSEQRKDLFVKLKRFGLNTYMYAPKDDFKHRAYWRDLYSVEEAENLGSLITSAKENGILFVYALSPGLDIAYSNPKEVVCLRRKLEQVAQLGCTAFALLFDDIEPEISESDKEVFQSFAHAQVSVTNEIYQILGSPRFLFCPTEYCTTRAVPNVQNSEYLNTIGVKLLPGIDIMWTGSKVISKTITVQSMQELAEVLRRCPVIWDNLHANDYDQKRLFLGPYAGRSTDLIPHLRGVLSNPNCEYEPNFIPIHSLAQWSKCNSDAKLELGSVCADIKLETESESGSIEDIPTHLSPTTYHPKKALKIAIHDWLPEFYKVKSACGRTSTFLPVPLAPILPPLNCLSAGPDVPVAPNIIQENGQTQESSETAMEPASQLEISKDIEPTEMLPPIAKEIAQTVQSLEPMDCNPTPCSSPKHICDAQMDDPNTVKADSSETESIEPPSENVVTGIQSVDSAEDMQTESCSIDCDDETRANLLTYDDIALLIDLFYLPFEHGNQGIIFLQEFQWLKTNGHLVSEYRRKRMSEPESPEVSEWYERARKFDEMTSAAGRLLTKLTFCKNRSLLYDLYPYVWDIKGIISLLNSYVKWLGFSKGYKEAFLSGEQEPWLFRGGLTGELQRLLPVESVNDLFLYKPPESPSSRIYTIRPYLSSDEQHVYEVCRKTFNDGDESVNFDLHPDLIGDDVVGAFLCLSPEYCFVVEDEVGICGYVVAALDFQQFQKKVEVAWIPDMCNKYPAPEEKENSEMLLTSSEELINKFHCSNRNHDQIPDCVYKNHPSVIRLNVLPHIMDFSVPKRILACVIAALKANGSHGVFCEVSTNHKKIIEFYSRLGFLKIQTPGTNSESIMFLGRSI